MTSLTANFRLICGPAGIRAGEQSVSELSKRITIPTGPQRRLKQLVMLRLFMRVGGKPRKAPTKSKSN